MQEEEGDETDNDEAEWAKYVYNSTWQVLNPTIELLNVHWMYLASHTEYFTPSCTFFA